MSDKISKLNLAHFAWGSSGGASLGVLRVKPGLRLVQGALLTIIVILMTGDVSCNPEPINICTAKGTFLLELKTTFKNIPMLTTRHLIEVPIVNEQRQRQSVEDL